MRIGVILLSWNSAAETVRCIDSVKRGTLLPEWITVWDNGSTDDCVGTIRSRHDDVVVFRSSHNLGFPAPNNALAKWLIDQGADAIWLLNNDTVVDSQCLQNLVEGLHRHPAAVAATGKIFFRKHPRRIWYAGGRIRRFTFEAEHLGAGQLDTGRFDQERFVEFVSGCCALLRSEVVVRHRLFRPGFFVYTEDLDWSLRMKRVGKKLLYVPAALLLHDVSVSMFRNRPDPGRLSAYQHYHSARNQLFVIREHASSRIQAAIGAILWWGKRLPFALANAALRRGAKTRAIVRGLIHGLVQPIPELPSIEDCDISKMTVEVRRLA
ncbi:MAG: hypothetical protein DRP22_02950 [Verrucomicrobia bacterium]|nr:MAG: hypothetical protein DRP22_02950 [Verrucomicrobiota bacterium]